MLRRRRHLTPLPLLLAASLLQGCYLHRPADLTVLADKTGQPVPGAAVHVYVPEKFFEGQGRDFKTGPDGRARIGLAIGESSRINVSAEGFDDAHLTAESDDPPIVVRLKPQTFHVWRGDPRPFYGPQRGPHLRVE